MRHFTHLDAHSVEEALALLEQYDGKAQFNAGGTDLITVLRGDILPVYPKAVINLKTIPGLDNIRYSEQTLHIGAMVKLSDLAENPIVRQIAPALADAAQAVGSPQIRNAATLGGNLCQNTRCWYYRYPAHLNGGCSLTCPRKGSGACLAVTGDNRYHAIIGGKKCFAVCPSDTAIALAAMRASVLLESSRGTRKVPIADFYHPLGTVMDKEVLTEIEIPITAGTAYQSFRKFAQRKAIDFAVCSACAVLETDDNHRVSGTVVLGAIAPYPVCLNVTEYIREKQFTEETIEEIAKNAVQNARPLSMNDYKVQIAKTMVKDVLYDIHKAITEK